MRISDWTDVCASDLVITTFIFAPYCTARVIGDPIEGQSLWGFMQAFSAVLVALGAPFLGAIADAGGRRKPWLLGFQAMLAFGCGLLWLAQPGQPQLLPLVIIGLVLANVARSEERRVGKGCGRNGKFWWSPYT